MRRPSTITVQAPHWPWSQPFFTDITPSSSRSASSTLMRGSRFSCRSVPSTVSLTPTSCPVIGRPPKKCVGVRHRRGPFDSYQLSG